MDQNEQPLAKKINSPKLQKPKTLDITININTNKQDNFNKAHDRLSNMQTYISMLATLQQHKSES